MSSQELRTPIGRATKTEIIESIVGFQRDEQSDAVSTNRVRIRPMWEWDLITRAAGAAIKRYEECLRGDDAIDARAAVGEALWWISSADEFLQKRLSFDVSRKEYYAGLGQTREGRLIGALSFLRNRAGHQIASVLSGTPTSSVSLPFTVVGEDGVARDKEVVVSLLKAVNPFAQADPAGYKFASLNNLPSPDKRFAERLDRDTWYGELVAGQAVGAVLAESVEILSRAISIVRQGDNLKVEISVDRLPVEPAD